MLGSCVAGWHSRTMQNHNTFIGIYWKPKNWKLIYRICRKYWNWFRSIFLFLIVYSHRVTATQRNEVSQMPQILNRTVSSIRNSSSAVFSLSSFLFVFHFQRQYVAIKIKRESEGRRREWNERNNFNEKQKRRCAFQIQLCFTEQFSFPSLSLLTTTTMWLFFCSLHFCAIEKIWENLMNRNWFMAQRCILTS